MRIVFMGSADFAVPSLEALVKAEYDLLAVVTQPDRPRGRGRKLAFTPVKEKALELGLPLYQPVSARSPEFAAWLRQLNPDIAVVVAYGQILPVEVLAIPVHGGINVHASLLPRYRGAAPVHWAVLQGEKVTGVSTMYMDVGMDTGDIILQQSIPISEEATAGEIYDWLAREGATLLVKTLQLIQEGKAPRLPQEASAATYAPALQREDEKIDWTKPAEDIRNQIRGLNPWPGAYTEWEGKVLKVWRAQKWDGPDHEEGTFYQPGRIQGIVKNQGILVQTGKGLLLLTEVQPTGKQRMKAVDFCRGYRVGESTLLG
ncbi:MAG: methionyl-tRNA formyltransferase [Syntrophomonadaceae bacterium]|nr:methionyl-tRNA formyltransferase [Syntrophomonadaceae bacterium]